MSGDDDNYILDADGRRVLVGLTFDETLEFVRLDDAILAGASEDADESRSRNERRWLVLYDKHDAALQDYISTGNARALRALRWEWDAPDEALRKRWK
jgi:hypothetical protein